MGFPSGTSGKEPAAKADRCQKRRFSPWVGKIPWRRARQPMPVFLPGEFLRGKSRQAAVHRVAALDTTEWFITHTHTNTLTQDCSAAISTEVYVCTHPPNCPSIHTSMYHAKLPPFLTWIFAIISLVSLYLLLPSTEIISHFNQPAVLEMQIWSLFCLKSFHDSPLLLGQKLQSFSK